MTSAFFTKLRIRSLASWLLCALLVLLAACETNMIIVNDVEEREANEIVVFLASKNIPADKIAASTAPGGGGGGGIPLWSIAVPPSQSTEAMALLNQNGLPRRRGVNLLDLFAKAGLMSSEREETIRYQAGLAEQIANTIRKIDGVIDADVQLSFPPAETGIPGATVLRKVTASVYVKHQGILDDPNSHLVTKIKRLVAGSVSGLDVNDVTVISDRSRLTDITLMPQMEELTPKPKEYVSIWSIVMSKSSASRFRTLFFILSILTLVLGAAIGWMVWKFYPLLKRGRGFKELLNPIPVETQKRAPKKERAPPEERT